MRLPGRRGAASQTDFHLYPLTFRELLLLKGALTNRLPNWNIRKYPNGRVLTRASTQSLHGLPALPLAVELAKLGS